MTFEQFEKLVDGFEIYPQMVDGKCCGALLVSGSEIHACILPWAHGRWMNRSVLRLINQLIDTHGEAATHATTSDGVQFVQALGFTLDGNTYRRKTKWALNQS